jgi:hypothetical protein
MRTSDIFDPSEGRRILAVWLDKNENNRFMVPALVWDDPAAWGILFADLISFVGSVYEAEGLSTHKSAVDRIIDGIRAELGDVF